MCQVKRRSNGILIALLCQMLLACVPQKASELQGRYTASIGPDSIELLLQDEGRYEQQLVAPSASPKVISRGTWSYYPEQSRIDLTNLRSVDVASCSSAAGCRVGEAGNASLPVERNFLIGAIRIGTEEGNPYIRRQ